MCCHKPVKADGDGGLAVAGALLLGLPAAMAFFVLAMHGVLLWQAANEARARVMHAAEVAAGAAARPGEALQGGMALDAAVAAAVFTAALVDQFPGGRLLAAPPRVVAVEVLPPGSTAPDGRLVPAEALWVDVDVPLHVGRMAVDLPIRGLAFAPAYPGAVP